MVLWTAFIIGMAGSFHCVGMCGPIALALPGKKSNVLKLIISRLLYNLGRMISYALLGGIFGTLGLGIFLAGYQRLVSIVLGVLIIVVVLIPANKFNTFLAKSGFQNYQKLSQQVFQKIIHLNLNAGLFFIGILNGFLPCGFVYMGLAGAVSTGSIHRGMLYMLLFGLGTLPIMFLTALLGDFLGIKLREKINRLLPIGAIILALIFILRGLSLGIPFLSPIIDLTCHH